VKRTSILGRIAVLLFLAVCGTGQAKAATLIVDQAADRAADTNPGTEEQPFKTIQHAAKVARSGDNVLVMTGRYDERIKVTTTGVQGGQLPFAQCPGVQLS
jgi:hypothetical protein